MIVLATVDNDSTDAKELVELTQGFKTAFALSHGKLVEHLNPGFVA